MRSNGVQVIGGLLCPHPRESLLQPLIAREDPQWESVRQEAAGTGRLPVVRADSIGPDLLGEASESLPGLSFSFAALQPLVPRRVAHDQVRFSESLACGESEEGEGG